MKNFLGLLFKNYVRDNLYVIKAISGNWGQFLEEIFKYKFWFFKKNDLEVILFTISATGKAAFQGVLGLFKHPWINKLINKN